MKRGRLLTILCALPAAIALGMAVAILGAVAAIVCLVAMVLSATVEKTYAAFRLAIHATAGGPIR